MLYFNIIYWVFLVFITINIIIFTVINICVKLFLFEMSWCVFRGMSLKNSKTFSNTASISKQQNRLFWIPSTVFYVIQNTVKTRTVFSASEKLERKFWPSGLRIAVKISVFLEQAIGEKEEKFMKKNKKRIDPDMPIGKLTEIPDFLPPPHELAKAKTIVVTTIGLDAETISFFKKEARKRGSKYQKMIREVLERYVNHYKKAA